MARSTKTIARPVLAVDVVLLGRDRDRLGVALHRRDEEPFAGTLALPGVAVQADETLAQAAQRALATKLGIACLAQAAIHVEQLATFDALYRDPRGRTVSAAYLGLSRDRLPLGPGASWVALGSVPAGTLPFDHDEVLATAVERLRGKLRYTAIASHLLPERFHVEELRAVYEAVLGRQLNRSNFRSRLLKIGLIERVGVDSEHVGQRGGRPPHLYRFVSLGQLNPERDFF